MRWFDFNVKINGLLSRNTKLVDERLSLVYSASLPANRLCRTCTEVRAQYHEKRNSQLQVALGVDHPRRLHGQCVSRLKIDTYAFHASPNYVCAPVSTIRWIRAYTGLSTRDCSYGLWLDHGLANICLRYYVTSFSLHLLLPLWTHISNRFGLANLISRELKDPDLHSTVSSYNMHTGA